MCVVTMDDRRRVLQPGSVVLDGPVVVAVSPERPDGPFDRVVDARGCIVTPGLINTHHHLYQSLTRVMPFVQDAKLFDWLVGLYEIWRELAAEGARTGALVSLGELMLSGCTTVADHHYLFPRDQGTSLLDATIGAARELGVRFHPTRGSMSRGRSRGGLPPDELCQDEPEILADCQRVIESYHDPEPLAMCRVALAPCSPFSVSEQLMAQTAELARAHGVRLHTHLAETIDEEAYCLEQYGVRPLELMRRVGWLGDDVWFAHGIHFNGDELDVLAETGTGIAHCPSSNLRLGSGIARVPEMRARGVPVGLAVDGSSSNDGGNLLAETRLATLVHRIGTGVEQMPAAVALELATRGSARVLGRDDIGVLAPGKAADLAIYDLDDIAYAGTAHDPVAGLVMTAGPARARTVVVDGELVVDGGVLVGINASAVREDADRISAEMVERMHRRTGIDPTRHRV
jgi:cytosine/adenosine deaminase-related metal-dependent hydrolase